MKRRPKRAYIYKVKRTYIHKDMDDLLEQTREQLSLKAASMGVAKDFTRIETSKIIAQRFREYNQRTKRKDKDNGFKMWDF